MTRTRPTGSPRGTPSVLSSSSGPLTPQTGTSDSSSSRRHDTRSAASGDMASQVAAIRLEGNPDLPLPSVERAPTDSSAGIDTPAETSHSRTPSLSISPPPSDGPMTRRSQVPGAIRGQRSTGDESSGAGGRLGMAEVAVALDRVARGSDSPGTHLRPVNPSVGAAASRRVVSRRRSSSRTSTEPHKVTDEKPPDDRFNRPEFQQAFSDAKGAVDKLSRILASSTLHDEAGSTVMRLHQKATDLATFQCPLTRTIGFVGDSGVGKSSLLNSLLDKRGLARTSNSGAACTCVVTEYHYHDEDKFIVQVDLFSSSELHAQLTNHLESYRHYHLHGDEMDAEQRQDFEEQALLARDTFRAMFRGRMSDENFLIEREKEDVLKTLQTWAEVGAESMEYQYERNSCEECSAVLIGLTSEAHSSQSPAMWPYIKKIKVSLKTHILSKGLVLVDLPGLRDVNSARQAITERYLLKCDGIFVVCNIGRATTDAAVANVFELAVRTRLSNVGIVCTKSDDIRADEAKEDWGEGEALRIQSLMDAVAAEQANLQTIQAELDEFGELDELSPDELVEHHTLSSQSRRAGRQLASHKFELKKYLIETRNSSVTADLNTAYADKIANNDLRVFCVSNTEYWDHRDSPRDDALPHLQLSGILSLRKYCIAMVSENQLRIATQYIRSDVPALLGDVDLWVQSGAGSITAEHKARIRETLHVVEKRLVREFTGTSSQLRRVARSCKNLFQDHVSARFTIGPWTNAARAASNEWRGWHHSTYSAFCRNYGNYCTSAVGAHNWNEEAIHQMTSDLALPWQGLRSALQNAHHDNLAMVVSLWTWAVEFLDNELGDEDRSTDILKGALESRQDLLSNTLEAAFAQFETKLITLETDALCGIRTSFIGQLMEGSYRACNFESGRGSDVRRKDIITRRLSDQAVFQSLHTNFQNGFQALANEFQDSVRSAIKEHLGVVQGTLDIIRSENVALESERDPAFRGRVQAGVGAARAEIGRIRAAIAS